MGSRRDAPPSDCPTDDVIAGFRAGTLSAARDARVRRHIDGCERCATAALGSDAEDPRPTVRGDPDRTANKIHVGQAFAGKYRVESILGSGGMGTVLRANQTELDRRVAIKVMHAELLTIGDSAKRFSLEARATAALRSKHTVRILDIDRLPSGVPFIVMELLDGRDLATLVSDDGPIPFDTALTYMLQACDAIEEAHENGIVHRDIKPNNVFLTKEGIVKVVDFGLAKALHAPSSGADSVNTKTNMLIGSPHYMPPEQIRSSKDVDERADVWALGATLYHLLTGLPPFLAPSLQLLCARIATEEHERASTRMEDVPPAIDAVIARCLEKEPSARYRNATELRIALEDVALDPNAATTLRQTTVELPSAFPVSTRRGLPSLGPDHEVATSPSPQIVVPRKPLPAVRPPPRVRREPASMAPVTEADTPRVAHHTDPPPAVRPGRDEAPLDSSGAQTQRVKKRRRD